jgi:hypothetical protein
MSQKSILSVNLIEELFLMEYHDALLTQFPQIYPSFRLGSVKVQHDIYEIQRRSVQCKELYFVI